MIKWYDIFVRHSVWQQWALCLLLPSVDSRQSVYIWCPFAAIKIQKVINPIPNRGTEREVGGAIFSKVRGSNLSSGNDQIFSLL